MTSRKPETKPRTAKKPVPRQSRPATHSKTTANPLQGKWRIVWMEMWDQDFVDAEAQGHVTFSEKGEGRFQFGYVQGSFFWHADEADLDATWEGNDEMDEAFGNIDAEIIKGELHGTISFFTGDESAFRAAKTH
jgi:hypothetical protein